jgi:hypothetical protein
MAMPAIVESFNVVRYVVSRQRPVLVDTFLDPFLLQAAEEGLCDGIVPAIAFRLMLGSK